MPLQNRVTPSGEILSTAARGTFLGNRGGVLHNDRREIVRSYASRRWITCLLEFKGRWRAVMSPRRYTELFFLDEAVALAAGHRPCAECRRERFNAFKRAWMLSGNSRGKRFVYADEIDLELHPSRIDPRRGKVTFRAPPSSLPDGSFIEIANSSYLLWGAKMFRWSPSGYLDTHPRSTDSLVTVLTPEPIVRCLQHGYKPEIHNSSQ